MDEGADRDNEENDAPNLGDDSIHVLNWFYVLVVSNKTNN